MKIDKPWGYEIRWAMNDKYLGKILHINAGQRLSLQYHEVKDESIYVVKGTLIVRNQHKIIRVLEEGESMRIQPRVVHRFCAPSEFDVEIVEVSTPELDDIVRLEDDYGRLSQDS
tara:strand:+ start:2730 stop:3074 length:345 start_codon:yes stop_codon:yes gene_type:complete